MLTVALLLTLPGFLMGASARSLPTRTHVVRKLEVAAATAPGPTTPLVSDFKKDNVSAKWAEGHPKIWSQEAKKFEIALPVSLTSHGFDGAVSEDGKFLVLVNQTATQVLDLDTGAVISTINKPETLNYRSPRIAVVSAPGGGYAVLESYDNDGSKTTEQRLTKDGAATGEVVVRPGRFSYFDAQAFSSDKRHFLTINGQVVHVNDLEDPDSIISLAGHTDGVMSADFSPDGKQISTTAWDGYTRVWDLNGKLIKKIGPSGGQNWFTSFSGDGKSLLYSVGSGDPRIDIVPVSDLTAKPMRIGVNGWARSIAWSPDNQLLAFGTSATELFIVKPSDGTIVQKWQAKNSGWSEINQVSWLDGGKKVAFQFNYGVEVYDLQENLKYRWGPDELDQYNTGLNSYYQVKSRGWLGTTDGDQVVRFWPFPA